MTARRLVLSAVGAAALLAGCAKPEPPPKPEPKACKVVISDSMRYKEFKTDGVSIVGMRACFVSEAGMYVCAAYTLVGCYGEHDMSIDGGGQ